MKNKAALSGLALWGAFFAVDSRMRLNDPEAPLIMNCRFQWN
ncbi:hypothetical protein [Burkholderia stagnalis]|nr:hypothetical protein [Burkholderia stagnalis]